MKNWHKIVLGVLINLPWFLWAFGVPDIGKLKGSRGPKVKIHTVVDQFEQEFWGRSMLIRLRNQFLYSVHHEIRARNVIQGQTGVLFEESYFKSTLGWDALDSATVLEKFDRFKNWQQESGVPLTFVVVPGKTSVVTREHWPEKYAQEKPIVKNANYHAFRELFSSDTTLRFLDYVRRFRENPNALYTTYPRNSVHWSEAANMVMTQEIVEGIQGIQVHIKDTTVGEPYGTEEDIEESMNLIFDLEDDPSVHFSRRWDSIAVPPKVLIIGDSYAWGLLRAGLLNHAANGSQFWYYNRTIHGPQVQQQGAHLRKYYAWESEEEFITTMSDFDQIIWVVVESNLKKFPFEIEYFKK